VPNPQCSSVCDCTCVLTRNRTLSRNSLVLAMRILFCSCPCKLHSRVSDALSQALCNLSLVAFLADFTLSDSTAPIRFIVILANYTQIHTHAGFPQSKKWPTYHVAVPTGNALASQRSENRLNFRPSSAAEKVSIVCGTNNRVKSEMLSNRHTQTKYCNPRCGCAPRVN